jgi:hypothetical protein
MMAASNETRSDNLVKQRLGSRRQDFADSYHPRRLDRSSFVVSICSDHAPTEEPIMQNVTATADTSLVGIAGSPATPRSPRHDTGKASGDATTAAATTIRLDRHIRARDLHPGDVMQQYDWSLHVREVEVSHDAVAIAVTEFGFPLHYAADQQVLLAA